MNISVTWMTWNSSQNTTKSNKLAKRDPLLMTTISAISVFISIESRKEKCVQKEGQDDHNVLQI